MLLTTLAHRVQRRRRVLQWTDRSWQLASRRDMDERIRILFDGNEVEHVWVTTIDLQNTGNDAVPTEAYVEPIRIKLDGEALLLDATLGGSAAGDGKLQFASATEILVGPRLFNPNDELTVSLITDRPVKCDLHVRAVNTQVQWRSSPGEDRLMPSKPMQLLVLFLSSALAAVFYSEDIHVGSVRWETIGVILTTLLMAVILAIQSRNDDIRQRRGRTHVAKPGTYDVD